MILLFRSPDSTLAERVAQRLGARARVLDLDAAERGEPLLVADGRTHWQGQDLAEARLAWLEEPHFAWPQPWLEGAAPAAGGAAREARALALSALHVLAARARCVNPLSAGALAAAPLVALDRLAAAGVPVAAWELASCPSGAADASWRDPVGRVRGYAPRPPAPGRPAWRSQAQRGRGLALLVIGEAVVGALRGEERLAAEQVPEDCTALALAAARALALDQVEVELGRAADGACVVALGAGPDLALWDRRLEGAVERGLTLWLDEIALDTERRETES